MPTKYVVACDGSSASGRAVKAAVEAGVGAALLVAAEAKEARPPRVGVLRA